MFLFYSFYLLFNYYSAEMQKTSKINEFEIISRLGEGSFGHVFKAKHIPTSEIYALKKIKTHGLTQKDKENALNQIRILASCQGKNIIGYKDSFYDDMTNCLYIVIEFAERGDLAGKIEEAKKMNQTIEQAQIWKAMVEITQGLRSLHVKKILHRDLKPANIFIMKDGTYKIGDLNISKVLKHGLTRTQTGTPFYTSPEIWNNKPYGNKVDIWSLGCILYEMATKRPPFPATNIHQLQRKICLGSFKKIPSTYSNELSSIISSMIRQNPSFRPSVNEILRNPAIKNYYNAQIETIQMEDDVLMKTIVLQGGNWKQVNLPKARYQGSQEKIKGLSLEKKKSGESEAGGNTSRSRVSVVSLYKDKDTRMQQVVQQQKINQLRQIKKTQRQRQRILSACDPNRQNKALKKTDLFPPKPKKTELNMLPPKPVQQKQNPNRPPLESKRSLSKQNLQNAGEYVLAAQNGDKTVKK